MDKGERAFTQRDMQTVIVDRAGKLVESGDTSGPVIFMPRWLYEESQKDNEEEA